MRWKRKKNQHESNVSQFASADANGFFAQAELLNTTLFSLLNIQINAGKVVYEGKDSIVARLLLLLLFLLDADEIIIKFEQKKHTHTQRDDNKTTSTNRYQPNNSFFCYTTSSNANTWNIHSLTIMISFVNYNLFNFIWKFSVIFFFLHLMHLVF